MTRTTPAPARGPVKSAERTLELLELLASTSERLSLTEISRRLGLPKSSLHHLLRTMEQRGWVESDALTGTRYGIGLRALLAGTSYVDRDEVVTFTAPVLDRLNDELGEAVHLGRADHAEVVYLAKRESRHPLRMFSAVGRRLPAHASAMGKAILASMPWDEVDALLPEELVALTPSTITTRPALQAELELTAERGYAVDDGESTESMRAVAVLLPLSAPAVNAISVSAPSVRMRSDDLPRVATSIAAAIGSLGAVQTPQILTTAR